MCNEMFKAYFDSVFELSGVAFSMALFALGWASCSNFAIATYSRLVDGFISLRFY